MTVAPRRGHRPVNSTSNSPGQRRSMRASCQRGGRLERAARHHQHAERTGDRGAAAGRKQHAPGGRQPLEVHLLAAAVSGPHEHRARARRGVLKFAQFVTGIERRRRIVALGAHQRDIGRDARQSERFEPGERHHRRHTTGQHVIGPQHELARSAILERRCRASSPCASRMVRISPAGTRSPGSFAARALLGARRAGRGLLRR